MPDDPTGDITGTNPPAAGSTGSGEAAPVNPQGTPPSDPQARISALQSMADKARAEKDKFEQERNAAITERAKLQTELDRIKGEMTKAVSDAAEATRQALDKATKLEQENADLKPKVTRAEFLLQNPDLGPYAALLPTTADPAELQRQAEAIRAARTQDIATEKERIRLGIVPPANPQRPSVGNKDPEQIKKYLRGAKTQLEWEERHAEVIKSLETP